MSIFRGKSTVPFRKPTYIVPNFELKVNLCKLYKLHPLYFSFYTSSNFFIFEYYNLVIVYNFNFSKYYTKQYKKGAKYEFIMYKNQQRKYSHISAK